MKESLDNIKNMVDEVSKSMENIHPAGRRAGLGGFLAIGVFILRETELGKLTLEEAKEAQDHLRSRLPSD